MTAPTVDAPALSPAATVYPCGWRGLILPTNTSSGDNRIYRLADPADLQVRPLPLPLSAQERLADGHDGSVVIGLVTRVWADEAGVWGEGCIDVDDPVAAEWARRLSVGTAGWTSADFDEVRATCIPIDDDGNDLDPTIADCDDDGDYRTEITAWRLMGATLVAQQAFAECRIGLVDDVAIPDGQTPAPVVASADTTGHTGGMIALIPAAEDAARLAVPGGEPVAELHLTLAYLGDDVRGVPAETRRALIDAVTAVAPAGPVDGLVFGHAALVDAGCAVYLTEADGLTALRRTVVDACAPILPEAGGHDGFLPHITAGYGLNPAALTEVGPVKFDRLRVALAGEHVDIPLERITAALVAAGISYELDEFADPQLEEPTALTVTADGQVYGHLAAWGVEHIGFPGRRITPPHSTSGYRYFHQGVVSTSAGDLPVGKLTIGCGHASTDPSVTAAAAAAHYDHSGSVVAVVRAGEDAHGIWLAGRILPGTPAARVDELRRCGVSGDWRGIGGRMELVAALAVNVPGFPIPRTETLVAGGAVLALTAAGIVRQGTAERRRRHDLAARRAAAYARVNAPRVEAAKARVRAVRAARAISRVNAAAGGRSWDEALHPRGHGGKFGRAPQRSAPDEPDAGPAGDPAESAEPSDAPERIPAPTAEPVEEPSFGPLPPRAPVGSEGFARSYAAAETITVDTVHPPEPYSDRQATPEFVTEHELVSPPDDPLQAALDGGDENAARAAAGLIALGVDARTVAEVNTIEEFNQGWKTADLLVVGEHLAEVKGVTTATEKRVLVRIREAREQARHVIIDGTQGELTMDTARSAVNRVVSNPAIGPHLDELHIVTRGGTVHWVRG